MIDTVGSLGNVTAGVLSANSVTIIETYNVIHIHNSTIFCIYIYMCVLLVDI